MEYIEISQLRQSEKSTVHLVREKDGDQVYIRKILKGRHSVYGALRGLEHACLPKLYEVDISDTGTVIIEEYVEGQSLGCVELSEKQFIRVVKELCSVLGFLHENGIIHRDIKPSNIIFAEDGHIRLIDFDAARMPKDDLEQDTELLGTRGYAPPEQYGFSQTDERADIYSLGVTLKQLLGDKATKPRYKRIISKCTNLDPNKRYQSVRQVEGAFTYRGRHAVCGFAALLAAVLLGICALYLSVSRDEMQAVNIDSENEEGLTVLPAPENPHWDGETGLGAWVDVPESGIAGQSAYAWRLYKTNTAEPPDTDKDEWYREGDMRGDPGEDGFFRTNIGMDLTENGFYYFTVCAVGDGEQYADSPYVLSDVFEYTGEFAPELPAPTGLAWKLLEGEREREYYATWSNFDVYADGDYFNVYIYDKDGNYVMNNIVSKEFMISKDNPGMRIKPEFISDINNAYRFTVQVYSSRPNEYRSVLLPDPVPEERYSPWYYPMGSEKK